MRQIAFMNAVFWGWHRLSKESSEYLIVGHGRTLETGIAEAKADTVCIQPGSAVHGIASLRINGFQSDQPQGLKELTKSACRALAPE